MLKLKVSLLKFLRFDVTNVDTNVVDANDIDIIGS
jgi:hypothetical protein